MTKSGIACIFLFLSLFVQAQFNIPPKPQSDQSLIFDYAQTQVLSSAEKSNLNQKLINYEKTTSTQIALILVDSTEGEDINFLAAQWGHQWGIGQDQKENGLIILLAIKDRTIAIQNGYGLEEYLTDQRSNQIIDQIIIPQFKKQDYYSGLDQGTDAIFEVLAGTFTEDSLPDQGFPWQILVFIVLFFIIIILASGGGKGGGNYRRRKGSLDDVIFTDFGRSTWSGGGFGSSNRGGSFGGGGFGGFGGGGFGGGGASGSW